MADEVPPESPLVVVPAPVVVHRRTTDQVSDTAIPYVRAGLTVLLVSALVGFFAVYKWAPDVLIVMASSAFGFYFGARTTTPTTGGSK